MKRISFSVTDEEDKIINDCVKKWWFSRKSELARVALKAYISRREAKRGRTSNTDKKSRASTAFKDEGVF